MTDRAPELRGLSSAEVNDRIERGETNSEVSLPSRTLSQILRANLFTRFNAILGALLVVIAFVGPVQDGLFGVVLSVNVAIGTIQEVRSKRALDRLALISAPVAHVRRDEMTLDLPPGEVVIDDVLEVRSGDQIVADAVLVQGNGLQVDESLLTGEALPVDKDHDDEILSGSIIVSGSGFARVIRVGSMAYAQHLQAEAKQFSRAYSELQYGTNQILRVISWLFLPMSALLATSQLVRSHLSLAEALRGTVAGIGAMVPEGLVLLTTMAFALGALRLARRNVLVQALPAIEGLARVDILCIDKTGTLTTQGMVFDHVVALEEDLDGVLGALGASDPDPNATMLAIATAFPSSANWQIISSTPFSSARKWSAMQFVDHGSWYLGAPDVLFDRNDYGRLFNLVDEQSATAGKRILVLSYSETPMAGGELPASLVPKGVIVLSEHIRPDAGKTIDYLARQGITIKVISGDDPRSVGAIARSVGIDIIGEPLDARTLPEKGPVLVDIVERTNVFGRVRPEQKRDIVEALQSVGHVVAMTGDGVNDVPSLKQADVGIAMGSGSQASRAIANIVLLDSAFAAVPDILGEGRRVIANIERVANLFVTKTVYATVLALVTGIIAVPYPFYPRQLTIVSSLTIGIPGFFLALATGAPRARSHFLRRTMRFSLPAGIGIALATMLTYAITRWPQHATTSHSKTAAAVTLFVIAIFVLSMLARPLDAWRLLLVCLMAGGGVLATLVPISQRVFSFSVPPVSLLTTVALVAAPTTVILWALLWRPSRPINRRGRSGIG